MSACATEFNLTRPFVYSLTTGYSGGFLFEDASLQQPGFTKLRNGDFFSCAVL